MIELLNNNKFVFGPNRRPIVQFAVENRQALQLQEQRRERIHAKQELLKNPMNKTLSFESNKKRKHREANSVEQTKNQMRLSEIIKQEKVNDAEVDQKNIKYEMNSTDHSNIEKFRKKKRSKTKSKGEIRDKFDRMIANTRNKPQLPQRTTKKWFE